jgi:hypothetical protein
MDRPQLVASMDPKARPAPREDRVHFVEHRGQRILLFEFQDLTDPAESLREIEKARAFVATHPPKSLRILTNVRNARYNGAVLQGMKELAKHDEPYVTASAVVGLSGLLRIAYTAVTAFSRRNIKVFDDETEALTWLASQPVGTPQ